MLCVGGWLLGTNKHKNKYVCAPPALIHKILKNMASMRRQNKPLRSSMFANCFFDILCAIPDSIHENKHIDYLHHKFDTLKNHDIRRKLFADYEFAKVYGDLFDDFLLAIARKVYSLIPILAFNPDRELILIIVLYYENIFFPHSRIKHAHANVETAVKAEAEKKADEVVEKHVEKKADEVVETEVEKKADEAIEKKVEVEADDECPPITTMTLQPIDNTPTEQIYLKDFKFNESDSSDEEGVPIYL